MNKLKNEIIITINAYGNINVTITGENTEVGFNQTGSINEVIKTILDSTNDYIITVAQLKMLQNKGE